METEKLIPLLFGAGVVAALAFTRKPQTAPPQQPVIVPPVVPPIVKPPVDPNSPEAAVLLTQLQTMMIQVATQPGSVSPEQMEALATKLEASGHPQEAASLRAMAIQLRAQRGVGTGAGFSGNDQALLAKYNDLLAAADNPKAPFDQVDAANVIVELSRRGYVNPSMNLQTAAARVRATKALPALPAGQVPAQIPSQLPAEDVATLQLLLNNPAADPAVLEAFAKKLEPYGFLTERTNLLAKAKQLRDRPLQTLMPV